MQIKSNLIIFCLASLALIGCASSIAQDPYTYQNMTCAQLEAELSRASALIEQSQANKEVGRAVGTGTTVAATGAGMAGVPYVGGAVSIARTLYNHTKQTRVDKTAQAENAYYMIEGIAIEKGCINDTAF